MKRLPSTACSKNETRPTAVRCKTCFEAIDTATYSSVGVVNWLIFT